MRALRITGLAVAFLVGAACGQAPAVNPSPTASTGLLFAALEANNTVAIAGLDGHARAQATFTPMSVPGTGCMGAILPPSAHVAAGKVFYADGHGVVRSLSVDGTLTTVATFPLTSTQQMLSFAVSPDGKSLLATLFTVPKDAFPCDGSPSTGSYSFDAYTAASGGPAKLVDHTTWTKPQNVLALTGWDADGPIGTYPTVWASQGGGPMSTLGVFVRVDAATVKVVAPFVAPSSCTVWDSVSSGAFVCMGDAVMTAGGTADQKVTQPVSVRQADGGELWHATVIGQNAPFGPYLAPDGQHVMVCCNDLNLSDPHELLVGRDGNQVNLAKGFHGSGWLDSKTMVGWLNTDPLAQGPFSLGYVVSNAPQTITSMNLAGVFLGTVST
jgi:hypothetical protein